MRCHIHVIKYISLILSVNIQNLKSFYVATVENEIIHTFHIKLYKKLRNIDNYNILIFLYFMLWSATAKAYPFGALNIICG